MRKLSFILAAVLLFFLLLPSASADIFEPRDVLSARLTALEVVEICGFSSEYEGDRGFMVRWEEPINLYVGGEPTPEDMETIENFIMQLAFRAPLLPNIHLVGTPEDANATMYFVPEAEMGDYVTDYVEGCWGFVYFWYNDYVVDQMEIAIASDVTDQYDRNHLILEEMVNGLGLINDHYLYSDSIIYGHWTGNQELSELDWMMINMLYHPDVYPGCTWTDFNDIMLDIIDK